MYDVDLRFFIHDVWEQVDIDKNATNFAFYLQFSDIENPVITRAPFSVEITIPATKNNNRLFDSIFGLSSVVFDFNPLLRTEYVLHVNNNVFQSGYFQLEGIALGRQGNPSSYAIRLYSGLGDYMYLLSTIKLRDLDFGEKFNHEINRNAVVSSWSGLPFTNEQGEDMSGFFGYAMTYQGAYNNFDSDYVVNPTDQVSEEATWYNQNKNYTSVALDEHKRTFVSGGTVYYGEYRSYCQKPMIKLRTVFEKILETLQQEGWTTIADESFFNDYNPYWNETWIICPNYDSTIDIAELTMPLTGTSEVFRGDNVEAAYLPQITGINTLAPGKQYNLVITIPFYLYAQYDSGGLFLLSKKDELTIAANLLVNGEVYQQLEYKEGKDLSAIRLDSSTVKQKNPFGWDFTPDSSFYYERRELGEDAQGNVYCPTKECGSVYTFFGIAGIDLSNATSPVELGIEFTINGNTYFSGNLSIPEHGISIELTDEAIIAVSSEGGAGIRSNSQVGYRDIIQSEVSCKDFMLSYTKPFGLMYEKDVASKTVRILTRNTFFKKREKRDWTDKLDYSKPTKIEPISFDYKTGVFAWGELETKYEQEYLTRYDRHYGSVRFDTNYGFGDEEKDFLSENIFNNCIIASDYSQYYLDRTQTLFKDNKTIPHFKDNSEAGVDINFVLVFRDGVLQSNSVFAVSDDNPNMLSLGYAWTTENLEPTQTYPKLLRTVQRGGQLYSLNFGRPNITYNDVETISDDDELAPESIYYRFWRAYLTDRLSLNTKRLKAWVNVNLVDVQDSLFNKFIYINDTLWVLEKLTAFNPLNRGVTQAQFIKVQNMEAYVQQSYLEGRFIIRDENGVALYDSQGEEAADILPVDFNITGTQSLTVFFDSTVEWSVNSLPGGVTVFPTQGGTGLTEVIISYENSAGTYIIGVEWGGNTALLRLNGSSLIVNNGENLTLDGCAANSATVPVTASGAWEITGEIPSWLNITPTSGAAGTSNITVSATGSTSVARSASIVFALSGTSVEYEFFVEQTACEQGNLRLSFNPAGGITSATVRVTIDDSATSYSMDSSGTGVELAIDSAPKVIRIEFLSYLTADSGGANGIMSISSGTPGIVIGQQCVNNTNVTVDEISPIMEVRVVLLPVDSPCS